MRDLMPRQPVLADWAWVSKKPEARDDSAIQARSRGDIEVSEIAWKYVAGVPGPNVPDDAPWAPPWVTFGAHLSPGLPPILSVSVQYPRDGLDQDGRAIWPRLFLACWYEDTMRRGASYRTLSAAIGAAIEHRDLSEDSGPVSLLIPAQPLDDEDREGSLAATVREFFRPLAAAAAALLDYQQVAVTGAMDLRLDRRLALLDAIAALLPYGFRADLSVSSAVDRKIAHRIRLVLTEDPADGQYETALDVAHSPPPGGPGRRYFEMLLEREEKYGLGAVLGHLWSAKGPYTFADPWAALDVLADLNRDDYRWDAVRSSEPVTLADALAVLDTSPDELRARWRRERSRDPRTLRKLLITLLLAETTQAMAALRPIWDIVFDDLVDLINQELNRGRVELAQRGLAVAGFGQQEKIADGLLARLLVPVGSLSSGRELWPDPIRFRVALLRGLPVPVPDTFTGTCDALRFHGVTDWQGEFVHALLSAELAGDRAGTRVIAWASWLCRSPFTGQWSRPDWVTALGFAVTDRAEAGSAPSVRPVIGQNQDWAVLILRLARSFGRLRAVLEIPDLDLYLLGLALRATARDGFRGALADALSAPLWAGELAAGTIACADVIRVMLGESPANFPEDRSNPQFDSYAAGLDRAFGSHPDRPWRGPGETAFLGHVAGSGDEGLSVAAVKLFNTWIKDGAFAPVLTEYIAEHDLAEKLLGDPVLEPDFWPLLIRYNPDRFQRYEPVVDLHAAARRAIEQPDTELASYTALLVDPVSGAERFVPVTSKLAEAMYKAWRAGMTADTILVAIANVPHQRGRPPGRVPAPVFHRVLREFRTLIQGHPGPEGRAPTVFAGERYAGPAGDVWAACLWLTVYGPVFGEDYARAFKEAFDDRPGYGEAYDKALGRIFRARRGLSRLRRSPESLYQRWRGLPPPVFAPRPQPAAVTAPTAGEPGRFWPGSRRKTDGRAGDDVTGGAPS
ncbi:MAG TPA: hypothetical protein VKU77_05035 [Streptosporangiaceae bacterium]|nr:hypothetical protein [Streptosporangiaceae bacterium]